jgi:hypothetical protein
LTCGSMLRECVKFEALAKILLHSEHFYDFFKYVEVSTFDIASDAFATFKVPLIHGYKHSKFIYLRMKIGIFLVT